MECQKKHFRLILLFYFRSGKRTADASHDICETYGVDTISQKSFENWFAKFRFANFLFKDEQCSGRPVGTDEDHLMALIEADRYTTVRVLTSASVGTVHNHINKLSLVKKLDVWVHH